MQMDDKEIWTRVKFLEGKTLYTYVENSKNVIQKVEDSGNSFDKVIIADRLTYPIKEDIIAACKLLYLNKEIFLDDLEWLAVPEKQTSSIVFRIIGEINKDKTDLIQKRKISLKLKVI